MLTVEDLNIITGTFLFRGISQDEAESLLSRCSCRIEFFQKRAVLFAPDSFRHELGILLEGRILVTKGDGLMIIELSAGDLFGAAALFTDQTDYVSTLTARTSCRVLFLTQEEMQLLIDRSALVRLNYIHYLSERIRFLSDKVNTLVLGSGSRKLSDWLLRNMEPGSDNLVTLTCSMTELARQLNCGRTSLYREMNLLESRGILHRTGKTIRILQPELLQQPGTSEV